MGMAIVFKTNNCTWFLVYLLTTNYNSLFFGIMYVSSYEWGIMSYKGLNI